MRAWHHTHGLPVLVTHCTNNYGPYQYREKVLPCLLAGGSAGESYHIPDRPGHDRCYALDAGKVRTELGWYLKNL